MPKLRRQHPVINYRNAIYQGGFNFNQQQRQGFGILYLSSKHHFIASHWVQDKLDGHSIVFIDSQKYIYGSWHKGQPHGILYSRFGQTVVIGSYQYGSINEKIILISEQYNIASVVSLSVDQQGKVNSEILSKGQLFSKERLEEFVNQCGWGEFSDSYETLVKYISENMITKKVVLQLINNSYYRFGFEKYGLAIIFDDYYSLKSVGVHLKSQLKGLGLRYLSKKVIQQGNWAPKGQVFAFSSLQTKPVMKINKLYRNFHLKEINYVNVFLNNESYQAYKQIQSIVKGELIRQLIAGMIYTSQKHSSFNSNTLQKSSQKQQLQKNSYNFQSKQKSVMKSKEEILIQKLTHEQIQRRKIEKVKNSIYDTLLRKQIAKQLTELQLSKSRLQQIQIEKERKAIQIQKSRQEQEIQKDSLDQESIIRKRPIGNIQLKNTPYRERPSALSSHSRSRSRSRPRSPIFTQKSRRKSQIHGHSPHQQLSPFTQKMRKRVNSKQKIFQNPYIIPVGRRQSPQQQHSKNTLNSSIRAKRHHKIFNQKQFALEPEIQITKQKYRNNQNIRSTKQYVASIVNPQQYQSPFDLISLNVSNSKANKLQQSSIQAMPISVKSKPKSYQQDHIKKLNFQIQNSNQIGPKSKFKEQKANSEIIVKDSDQIVKYNDQKAQKPAQKQLKIINPYQQRLKIQAAMDQSRKKKQALKYSSKDSINRFKTLVDKSKKKDEKNSLQKPKFPVKDNSAYLKQKSIPEIPNYSSPSKINRSPYKYFQENKHSEYKKTFDSQSKYESDQKSLKKKSNKPYYEPIQNGEISKIKVRESRDRSKSKTRYFNNQFKKRMEASPERRYTVDHIEQRKDQSLNNVDYYNANGKKKVINQSNSKGAYNYYFQ